MKSLEQLFLLGALTDECKLSDPVGHQMARLPLNPIYSKALILASEFKCLEEMLITVAMLSVESIFYVPREKVEEVCCEILFISFTFLLPAPQIPFKATWFIYILSVGQARAAMKCFSSPEGDHQTLINVYRGSDEFLEKRKFGLGKEKVEKILGKWCKENFINSRSLRHARDVHRLAMHIPMDMFLLKDPQSVFYFFLILTGASFFGSQIRGHVEQMGLHVTSCGDDMLQFRRCLAASFFLNGAIKQPEGTYRY